MKNMNEKRVEELINKMDSFKQMNYHRSDRLNEMFKLQSDVINLTFDDETDKASLKIWDAEKRLSQLNANLGNVADEELKKFKEDCKVLCNLIKAEISGQRGENKAFRTLEYIKTQNMILKNVELDDGNVRTELDALVITPGCLTIVEVKNTSRNIFIDENGDYYRTGEFLKWDCNIAEKMAVKEKLLSKVLSEAGLDEVQVRGIVVFTDNRIEVQNKYRQITTCFVSQLAHIIDGYSKVRELSDEKMDEIKNVVEKAARKEAYPADFDVEQFKLDFATLLTILEAASTERDEQKVVHTFKNNFWNGLRDFFSTKLVWNTSSAAAMVTLVSTIALNEIGKGGVR